MMAFNEWRNPNLQPTTHLQPKAGYAQRFVWKFAESPDGQKCVMEKEWRGF